MSEVTELFAEVKGLALNILQTDDASGTIGLDSPLLGHLPEFDSMSVVAILTAIEEQYGVVIEDDEVSADLFIDWRSLTEFVAAKLAE